MAAPDVISSRLIQVKIGDGETPTEAFTVKCTINNEKSINFEAGTQETNLYDCADPSAIPWTDVEITSLKANISGGGLANSTDIDFFYDWLTSGTPKNVKWTWPKAGAPVFTGPYVLTSFSLGASEGSKVNFTCAMASTGLVTSTAYA